MSLLLDTECTGGRTFNVDFECQYCWQTDESHHECIVEEEEYENCDSHNLAQRVKASCTVRDSVFCIGARTFPKYQLCQRTSGSNWWTAIGLSVITGGFGLDRFYLGYWALGLFKFVTFGGLGVWTLADAILIVLGYLHPADGSLYV